MHNPPALLIACLCADWCGACKEYAPLFVQLKAEFPLATFRWIDIEDEAALVDEVDVENFPTILIAQGTQAVFFGTVLPHIETLRRLITSQSDASAAARVTPEVQSLTARLMQSTRR